MIAIKTMNKLPEECEKCPCYATYDGHCQADDKLRTSIYRPFWCPLTLVEEESGICIRQHVCDEIDAAPTVDAVPIKPLCAWLAGYAAPPLYASDYVAMLKNKVSIKTETERAEAWEYHWQHLVECGLMEVDDADKT